MWTRSEEPGGGARVMPAVASSMRIGYQTILARTTEGLAALREKLDDGTHTGRSAKPAGERALAVALEQITGQGPWPTAREGQPRGRATWTTCAASASKTSAERSSWSTW
jgi:hypothetical protein